jgi:hypothetical protein
MVLSVSPRKQMWSFSLLLEFPFSLSSEKKFPPPPPVLYIYETNNVKYFRFPSELELKKNEIN